MSVNSKNNSITNRKQLEEFVVDFVDSYRSFSIKEITDINELRKIKPEFCGENKELGEILYNSIKFWKQHDWALNQFVGLYKEKVLLAIAIYEFGQDDDKSTYINLICKCSTESKTCNVSNIATLLIYWIIYRAQEYGQESVYLNPSSITDLDKLKAYYGKLGFINSGGFTPKMTLDITRVIEFPEEIKFEMKNISGGGKHKYKNRMYKIRIGSRGGKYILVNKNKIYI
jgi:hypothetical protein